MGIHLCKIWIMIYNLQLLKMRNTRLHIKNVNLLTTIATKGSWNCWLTICVPTSIPDNQHPYPGWLWYHPIAFSKRPTWYGHAHTIMFMVTLYCTLYLLEHKLIQQNFLERGKGGENWFWDLTLGTIHVQLFDQNFNPSHAYRSEINEEQEYQSSIHFLCN